MRVALGLAQSGRQGRKPCAAWVYSSWQGPGARAVRHLRMLHPASRGGRSTPGSHAHAIRPNGSSSRLPTIPTLLHANRPSFQRCRAQHDTSEVPSLAIGATPACVWCPVEQRCPFRRPTHSCREPARSLTPTSFAGPSRARVRLCSSLQTERRRSAALLPVSLLSSVRGRWPACVSSASSDGCQLCSASVHRCASATRR